MVLISCSGRRKKCRYKSRCGWPHRLIYTHSFSFRGWFHDKCLFVVLNKTWQCLWISVKYLHVFCTNWWNYHLPFCWQQTWSWFSAKLQKANLHLNMHENSYPSLPPPFPSLCLACCTEYTNSKGRSDVHFKVMEIWMYCFTVPLVLVFVMKKKQNTERRTAVIWLLIF